MISHEKRDTKFLTAHYPRTKRKKVCDGDDSESELNRWKKAARAYYKKKTVQQSWLALNFSHDRRVVKMGKFSSNVFL